MADQDLVLLVFGDLPLRWQTHELERMAERLNQRLQVPVEVIDLRDDDLVSFADSETAYDRWSARLQQVAIANTQRIAIVSLSLSSLDLIPLRSAIALSASDWVGEFYVAAQWSLREWADWFVNAARDVLQSVVESSEACHSKIPMLIVSKTNRCTEAICDVAQLAHNARQIGDDLDIHYCFVDGTRPTVQEFDMWIGDIWQSCAIVPWRISLADWRRESMFHISGSESAGLRPFVVRGEHAISIDLIEHCEWLSIMAGKYLEAMASVPLDFYPRSNDNAVSLEQAARKGLMDSREQMNRMLPSEYRNKAESVSPRSMGSAGLKRDADGRVAWDQIWTSFCDLAMAGGPPHRGKLLEAVSSVDAQERVEEYERVVEEIERGITLVTGLPTVRCNVAGWVGVRCSDETMAAWLLRAIIVENVMVRRETDVVYLPAGPDFRVEKEIKNVITSVAKTVHYWRAHLRQ